MSWPSQLVVIDSLVLNDDVVHTMAEEMGKMLPMYALISAPTAVDEQVSACTLLDGLCARFRQ
eukprot:CAMPEP_0183354558 /NCGR_PEP_ID=MMETSP0164_2-20130417/37387_1 /TAXON_ID=221442 /ORGANISM="Coccolithus pelagicus ssp braarudi, Strain PLY182g" /LENGTH=62 /DNA_ID=CAMNT_0025527459 /DNA_START=36 /DNA_END=221 /DNA_ORIENTATION=+